MVRFALDLHSRGKIQIPIVSDLFGFASQTFIRFELARSFFADGFYHRSIEAREVRSHGIAQKNDILCSKLMYRNLRHLA